MAGGGELAQARPGSGQFWEGLGIYWDHLASRCFIHGRRRLIGGDAVDRGSAARS